MSDPLIGERVGGFLIEDFLGRGAMGVVYFARDERGLQRQVALKLLAPKLLDDSSARTRFQREIKNAIEIEHPHIVPVYAAGYEDGYFFLAMRLVRGPDLGELVYQEGAFPEDRAMRLVGQIASALYSVHRQEVVHRDVKPSNVLVWNPGEIDEHAFLTDFGIAKALNETYRLTKMGALGTPGYMSPEVLAGADPTPACDQFSLACLAFELLTGRLPFEAAADGTVDFSDPLPLAYHAPRASKRVRETIERALAPDPGDRFEDVRAFVVRDEVAHEAFERSQAITDTVSERGSPSQLVLDLHTRHGLTDAAIAEIADLDKSQVVRLRRQAARRSLIGE